MGDGGEGIEQLTFYGLLYAAASACGHHRSACTWKVANRSNSNISTVKVYICSPGVLT